MNKYYVYEWFNKSNNYVFYVGKGCGNRYTKSKDINTIYGNIWKANKTNKTYLGFYFKY